MDWAEEVAAQIGATDGRSFHKETITKVASAIRKAKADGMREAASHCRSDQFWTPIFYADLFENWVKARAAEIEKDNK